MRYKLRFRSKSRAGSALINMNSLLSTFEPTEPVDARVNCKLSSVRMANTADERAAVFKFRYRVYIEEMRKRLNCDPEKRLLKDAMDDFSASLYVACGNEIVATLRRTLCSGNCLPQQYIEWFRLDEFLKSYPPEKFSVSSRLMVSREWRKSRAAAMLILEAYREARVRGVEFDFLLTNPSLISLYEHLGYRRYCDSVQDPDVGLLVPMVWTLADHEHLRAVKSPAWRVARHFAADSKGSEWLARHFPPQASLE